MNFRCLLSSSCAFVLIFLLFGEACAESTANNAEHVNDTIVLVRHGEVTVTRADFEAELEQVPPEQRDAFLASSERIHTLLANLFVQKVLAEEARKAGLDQDPLLKRRIELAADKLLASARLEHLIEETPEPDFEALARERYQADRENFQVPEQVRVSHILISTSERSEEEARARAEKVLDLVRQGEKPFSELAMEYSDDPSVKRNQGDLGYFEKGRMVEPFEEAAFALKESGDISPLVKTRFGFHIIRLEARKAPRSLSFDEVKERLIREVKEEHEARIRKLHLDRIRSLEGIETNQEAIEALKVPVDYSKAYTKANQPE